MRKALKFVHTLAGVGLLGALITLSIAIVQIPSPVEQPELYVAFRNLMDAIARWLLFPSLIFTLIAGMLSMVVVKSYLHAGWVWAKLATGIIMFEGTLLAVQGPMQKEAEQARAILAAGEGFEKLGTRLDGELYSIWILAAVCVLNVFLGVWRPRFSRTSDPAS